MVTIKCNSVLQLSVTYQTYLQTMRVGSVYLREGFFHHENQLLMLSEYCECFWYCCLQTWQKVTDIQVFIDLSCGTSVVTS